MPTIYNATTIVLMTHKIHLLTNNFAKSYKMNNLKQIGLVHHNNVGNTQNSMHTIPNYKVNTKKGGMKSYCGLITAICLHKVAELILIHEA